MELGWPSFFRSSRIAVYKSVGVLPFSPPRQHQFGMWKAEWISEERIKQGGTLFAISTSQQFKQRNDFCSTSDLPFDMIYFITGQGWSLCVSLHSVLNENGEHTPKTE